MITFNGVELKKPETDAQIDLGVICNETRLISGKVSVQSSPETGFRVSYTCHTENENDIDALAAKIGTEATLAIDGNEHTGCHINGFSKSTDGNGHWEYRVGFTQGTA